MKLVMKTLWQLLMTKKYRELKKSIRMMNSKRGDVEKIKKLKWRRHKNRH